MLPKQPPPSRSGANLQRLIAQLAEQYGWPAIFAAISKVMHDQAPTQEATDHPMHWARFNIDLARERLEHGTIQGGRN